MYQLLHQELQNYADKNGPIRIGIAGTGFIGGGLLAQIARLKEPLFRVAVIYFHSQDGLNKAVAQCNPHLEVSVCHHVDEVEACLARGSIPAVLDVDLIFIAGMDILMDVTGDIPFGAELACKSIQEGVPVMASPETDFTVGPELCRMAAKKGVVYSGFSGDEPGEIVNLVSYVRLMNFEIVGAGKFKNFHDPYATPESVRKWAELYHQNPYKLASFADGTKMNIEMAITANATGLIPDTPGMHCPKGTLETITSQIRPANEGGLLSQTGVLEIVQGAEPSGGVYVVGYCGDKKATSDLAYLKMGPGPYYLFYKPFHLCHFEILLGAAKVVLWKHPVLCPSKGRVADVSGYAKRDLKVGERLDDIGGYTFYGLVEKANPNGGGEFLSASLLAGGKVTVPVRKGEKLTRRNVAIREKGCLWRILKDQL